jgi:hypothetical protein
MKTREQFAYDNLDDIEVKKQFLAEYWQILPKLAVWHKQVTVSSAEETKSDKRTIEVGQFNENTIWTNEKTATGNSDLVLKIDVDGEINYSNIKSIFRVSTKSKQVHVEIMRPQRHLRGLYPRWTEQELKLAKFQKTTQRDQL